MLRISETTKKKFSGSLRQIMGELHVYSNCFLSSAAPLKKLDEIVKLDSEIQKQLALFISEEPLYIFSLDWIRRELYERSYREEITTDMAVPFGELDEIPSFESLASEIVRDFCNLPYGYKLFLPLPARLSGLLKDEEDEYEFGGGIRILRWTDELRSSFDKVTFKSASNVDETVFDELDVEDENGQFIVLELTMNGYFDKYSRGLSGEIAIEKIKSFFGLCYATGFCETKSDFTTLPVENLTVYRIDDGVPSEQTRYLSLDDSFKRACSSAAIASRIDLDRARGRVKKALASLKAERILLASKWLFDSRGGIDQLFAFLQCTICLEILLGEQKYADNLSVGDILSNRCAYMVGRNDEDRENILKEFKEIYAVRSEIVHRGKSRLSRQNRGQLLKLRNYCGRVIIKEIDLLASAV